MQSSILRNTQNTTNSSAVFEMGGTTYEYTSTGSWNHVAYVREGVNLRLYVNGVQRKTRGDFPIGGTIFTHITKIHITKIYTC